MINGKYDLSVNHYRQLHQWSVANSEDFWESNSQFTGVIANQRYDAASKIAIIARLENGERR